MSKKTPTPTPDVPPLKAVHSDNTQTPDEHEQIAKGLSILGYAPPGERNTEAVNALSNAPPYLMSRAETMYVAHCHAMDGEVRVHFNNLRPVERAAWLASAKATES